MTRFIAMTAAAMTATVMAATPSSAKITTLGECYQAVITWCNETFPDHDCSHPSGLDDCDEEFGNTSNTLPNFDANRFMMKIKRMSVEPPVLKVKRSR